MKTEIDIIVEDIFATEPELAKDTILVRQIVTHLLENKPQVEVDDAFRARLRRELLQSTTVQKNIKSGFSPWWFVYIAPIGVTAVLLVLFQPSLTETPQNLYEMSTMPPESSLKMNDSAGREESYSIMAPEANMDNGRVYNGSDIFTISTVPDLSGFVLEYVSLSRPGFVVVTSPEGVKVAASELILIGEYGEGISLPAIKNLQKGIIYTAQLYYDNGDGVYVEGEEELAWDGNGEPLNVLTGVTN